MSRISAIHHASVLVGDLERARAFYVDVLGLEADPARPTMSFNGAWLKVGSQQIHLLELPNPDPVSGRPEHAGRDRHTAFMVHGLDELRQRLDTAGVPYTGSSRRDAIFCRDPDGNGVELIEAVEFPVL